MKPSSRSSFSPGKDENGSQAKLRRAGGLPRRVPNVVQSLSRFAAVAAHSPTPRPRPRLPFPSHGHFCWRRRRRRSCAALSLSLSLAFARSSEPVKREELSPSHQGAIFDNGEEGRRRKRRRKKAMLRTRTPPRRQRRRRRHRCLVAIFHPFLRFPRLRLARPLSLSLSLSFHLLLLLLLLFDGSSLGFPLQWLRQNEQK